MLPDTRYLLSEKVPPRLQPSVWLKENPFLFLSEIVYWLFLWTLAFTCSSRTPRIRGYKTEDPAHTIPIFLHYFTWLPTVCTSLETLQYGDPKAQLDPSQEKGSLISLLWIQKTQGWNKHCAFVQTCTKDWKRIKGMWLASHLQGVLFAGRAEHRGRLGEQGVRGQELYT